MANKTSSSNRNIASSWTPIQKIFQFGDAVERTNHDIYDGRFPHYAKLWARFIGNKGELPVAERMDLIFPRGMSERERDKLSKRWDRFCMQHYSMFCRLANMRRHLGSAKEALQRLKEPWRLLEHWTAFEAFYDSLRAACFMYKGAWETVVMDKRSKSKAEQKLSGLRDFSDDVAHFARISSKVSEGGDYLIKKHWPKAEQRQARETWWDQLSRKGAEVPTTEKMEEDLESLEKAFNDLHSELIKHVETFLKANKITIDSEAFWRKRVARAEGRDVEHPKATKDLGKEPSSSEPHSSGRVTTSSGVFTGGSATYRGSRKWYSENDGATSGSLK